MSRPKPLWEEGVNALCACCSESCKQGIAVKLFSCRWYSPLKVGSDPNTDMLQKRSVVPRKRDGG